MASLRVVATAAFPKLSATRRNLYKNQRRTLAYVPSRPIRCEPADLARVEAPAPSAENQRQQRLQHGRDLQKSARQPVPERSRARKSARKREKPASGTFGRPHLR